jgi:hypothetical protein
MQNEGDINPQTALNLYGVFRLGAVIFNIRDEGYDVRTRMVYYTKPSGRRGRYASYSIANN